MIKWPRTRSGWLWTGVYVFLAVTVFLIVLFTSSSDDPPLGRDCLLAAIGFTSAVSLVFTEIALTLAHIGEAEQRASDRIADNISGAQEHIETEVLNVVGNIGPTIEQLTTELRNFATQQSGARRT